MDESKPLEEIRTWEHPPWYGIDQFKERVMLTFLENQKGPFHNLKTHFRKPEKRLMTSGPCQEASYTAITLNPESHFTRREKNHSLFHWNTLTNPELLIQIWMSSKKNASMIIGMSMGQETCLIHGQVSLNLVYWKKNLTDLCGRGEDWQENSLHPGQIIYGQSSGNQWERMPSWRRSKSGRMRRTIWRTHENCEESISSTPRIRHSRKPSRTRVRSWKHQWLLLCPVKLRKIVGVVHPTKFRQNLRDLEADESTRMRMGNSIPHYHEDHIAWKGENSLQHYNLVHKFIPMPQAMKIPAAKAAVDKEGAKCEKISALNLTKVRSKKEVIDEARTKGATVHFASLMDICHLKNAELKAKHQKYKGRVVLRGDFVKDDSWSYAVFTEQGSSASEVTAAKSWISSPDCRVAMDKQRTQCLHITK